jgi:hypothetical protein
MTFLAILEILFVATLMNILKLTFSGQMDLYCCIVVASLHLLSRIISFQSSSYTEVNPSYGILEISHKVILDNLPT